MHTPPNSVISSYASETSFLVRSDQPKRNITIPLCMSAFCGFVVAGALKTTILNSSITDIPDKMHLDTQLERFGVALVGGIITTVVGTVTGYFCQKAPAEVQHANIQHQDNTEEGQPVVTMFLEEVPNSQHEEI